jgi:glucose-6-phosphate 1-dehydrogenase
MDTVLDTMHMQMESTSSQQRNIEYAVQSLTDNLNYVSMNMENSATFNQKLTEISMQIEYLRVNQPSQLREILSTISLSTLALNDIALPSAIFTRIMDVGSSASQQGRRRIENN